MCLAFLVKGLLAGLGDLQDLNLSESDGDVTKGHAEVHAQHRVVPLNGGTLLKLHWWQDAFPFGLTLASSPNLHGSEGETTC